MYQELAKYYQNLVDAKSGSTFFCDLLLNYHKGQTILDCACGSGELVKLLHEKGYQVKGFDLSEAMINQSEVKSLLKVDNMTSFRYDEKFDTITCFCDSFNYLLSLEEVTLFFKNVWHHLNQNGIFIFDMHNYETLDVFQQEYYQEGIINKIPYQWSIVTQNDLLLHTFIFDQLKEEHIQKIYSLNVIVECLKTIGFEVQVLTEKELNGYESEKEVLICRKNSD